MGAFAAVAGLSPGAAGWSARGSGAGGASRIGVTTVDGAKAGCEVVSRGGSAENAGAAATSAARRTAVRRAKEEGKSNSGSPAAEGRAASLPSGLYVVATPIGNLGDITARALEVLRGADVVAAEDTRVTQGLLAHFAIGAKLVSVREHNERAASESILRLLGEGKSVALVSDAGTPAVSDPGSHLVERVRAAGCPVIPVPGASALTTALSASGIAAEGVVFAGFLPAKGADRKRRLADLAAGPWAIALFESPHRIEDTLADLHAALGDRDVVVCRELTKRFETITRVPLAVAVDWVRADENRSRGEFVLVIEARAVETGPAMDAGKVLGVLLEELSVKQAAALASKITGVNRSELYQAALAIKAGDGGDSSSKAKAKAKGKGERG
ncbi:MAG: 16S rRNA (cytidine(1402)-2'-O)-methyltransferase [Betaproteobacteria bacterium]|nr:16S rRNA (cytidine(1402)-2'-O)-methyltransferase [Betaproteobacteria bacterium]